MKNILIVLIFLSMDIPFAYSMSSFIKPEKSLPKGVSEYQLRVVGGNWLNFQGIIAYYDENGNTKTERIFANTPYIINFTSKGGVSAFFRVNNIQPTNRFGGIFRLLLFKGDEFVEEKRAFIMYGDISLQYGKYPNMNLEFMVLPGSRF